MAGPQEGVGTVFALLLLVGVMAAAGCRAVTPHVKTRGANEPASRARPTVLRSAPIELAQRVGEVDGEREDAKESPLVVTFLDVGQGDAILLEVGEVAVLVDAGPRGAWKGNLGRALKGRTRPLTALVITHPHADHVGGAAAVLGHLEVQAVYTNGEGRGPPRDRRPLAFWQEFERAVAAEGLAIRGLKVGEVLRPAPALTLTVLSSGGGFPDTPQGGHINNDSLVVMVEYGGRRILLTGDIEVGATRKLLKEHCAVAEPPCSALQADVLKVPHHGSASHDRRLFAAVSPTWAVISSGYRNKKDCLPRTETISALHGLGTKVLSTSAPDSEDVVLTVLAAGHLLWTAPTKDGFAWRTNAGGCEPRRVAQQL